VIATQTKKGTKVEYTEAIDEQIGGNCNDPRKYLKLNNIYTVDYTEIHSWHTKVYLKEITNKCFNSCHFEYARHRNFD